ncbi:MAG TPA: YetF domain-containing protein [Gaiellaceae bacterium]|nr:YetF domain-containing protein [Gaiellaceae bacterium]
MDLVLRALVAFLFVLLLTRVVGRRELSSLQPFDLILLVMIGDLVQQGVTQNDFSITGMLLVGSTIGLLAVFVSWTSFRFPRLRPVLDGEPVIVVQDGEPIQRNLNRNRLTLDELRAAARQEQIASLDDVQWAVLETSGRISFIPKDRAA